MTAYSILRHNGVPLVGGIMCRLCLASCADDRQAVTLFAARSRNCGALSLMKCMPAYPRSCTGRTPA
ncbi:DUF1993 domain-containing protein [Pseudomonas yamanorum]|uniref:DUF1993 domain-containing protein n=1 Tax=Pseudomonas yamanorum TaxID=515393 RepID=UPI00210D990A|nr:DUF1993 domain-containing protein [Pseudomonas yamanorum]